MDYKTIAAQTRAEYIEKRSKFIATGTPVASEAEAQNFIAGIAAQFHDARHNVFAYIIKDGVERFSDDGEPQGTAGLPVLEVLRRQGLVNIAMVVTRYFGGILLGAPGLVRAYAGATTLALAASSIVLMRHCDIIQISCGYDFYAHADGLARLFGGILNKRDFSGEVLLEIFMPKGKTFGFINAITESSAGTVEASAIGETFFAGD